MDWLLRGFNINAMKPHKSQYYKQLSYAERSKILALITPLISAQNISLREILIRKDRRIELLEGLLAQANALKFGSSSEKLPAGEQGSLFNEAEESCHINRN